MRSTPHQSHLRKGRFSEPGYPYFVTKCVAKGYVLSAEQRRDVCDTLLHARATGLLKLHAFVVMPDHWHALFSLSGKKSLSAVMSWICQYARFKWRDAGGGGYEWQQGYHDHKLRPRESVSQIVQYVEANPVRKGIVEAAEDWICSSAYKDHRGCLDREWLGHERWA